MDVTVNGPGIVLNDGAYDDGPDELLSGFNYRVSDILFDQPTDNPGLLPVVSYDRSTTVTVTNFTGDLVSSTIVSSFVGVTPNSPVFLQRSIGNYTNSTVSLTEFTIATTFTNINFLPGFETYSCFTSITATNNQIFSIYGFAGIPLPSTLALIGVGLIGLASLRRKKAA